MTRYIDRFDDDWPRSDGDGDDWAAHLESIAAELPGLLRRLGPEASRVNRLHDIVEHRGPLNLLRAVCNYQLANAELRVAIMETRNLLRPSPDDGETWKRGQENDS